MTATLSPLQAPAAHVRHVTGIRYARAARFMPPEPVDGDAGGGPSPACPQAPNAVCRFLRIDEVTELPVDEDCLRLSVSAPADAGPGAALPVMVWVHGGSYVFGAGDSPLFDPTALVAEQRVVVVRVTYRLGAFGFLRPANLGLLDLIAAFRWVGRHVAGYGGDPGNVTAFGESAGADAIAHLMIAEGAEGLFRRAIIQSAPLGLSRGKGRMNALMAAEAAKLPADAPAADVVALQGALTKRVLGMGVGSFMPFGCQYGHFPLPAEADADAAWERAAGRVEVLVGANQREAALFSGLLPPLGDALRVPVVSNLIEAALVGPFSWLIYRGGAATFARRHGRGGGRGYHYTFTWAASPDPACAGAHIAELPLLFPGPAWAGSRVLEGVSAAEVAARGERLRAVWAGFARDGQVPVGRLPGLLEVRAV